MKSRITLFLTDSGLPTWWVPDFPILLLVAILSGLYVTASLWKREGHSGSVVTWVGWALPLSFLGAKTFYLLEFGWPQDSSQLLSGGISLYGSLVGLLLGLWIAQKAYRFSLTSLLDCGAPALALSLAIGRVGCFLAGCNGGLPTGLPWAVSFPPQTSAHDWQVSHGWIAPSQSLSFPVHPTQLYESLFSLVACLLLLRLLRHREWDGQVFLAAMFWYATFRFATEYLRADPGSWPLAGLTFIQLVALIAAMLSGSILALHPGNGRSQNQGPFFEH